MSDIPPIPLTCGLIVSTPLGWLLGHATSTAYWDLPKGKKDPQEEPLEAALRECREETGLDLSHHKWACRDLGELVYNRKRGKTLRLFWLDLSEPLDLSVCRCTTHVFTRGHEPVLDMDAYAWVPVDEICSRVNKRMAKHLRLRGLLP